MNFQEMLNELNKMSLTLLDLDIQIGPNGRLSSEAETQFAAIKTRIKELDPILGDKNKPAPKIIAAIFETIKSYVEEIHEDEEKKRKI